MAEVLRCEDFMVKCPYAVRAATEGEVVREDTTHLVEAHRITTPTPGIAATVQRNIRTE